MNATKVIKDAIDRKYPAIELSATLQSAITKMAEDNASALVVKSGNEIIGLVTISDVMGSLAHGHHPEETPISNFMTRCELISGKGTANPCAQLDENQDVLTALKVMFSAGVNHLLVSGDKGEPVGLVSALQLVRLLGSAA